MDEISFGCRWHTDYAAGLAFAALNTLSLSDASCGAQLFVLEGSLKLLIDQLLDTLVLALAEAGRGLYSDLDTALGGPTIRQVLVSCITRCHFRCNLVFWPCS